MPKKKKSKKRKAKKTKKKKSSKKRRKIKKVSKTKKISTKKSGKKNIDKKLSNDEIIKTKPEWIKRGLANKSQYQKKNILNRLKIIIHFGKKKERELLG